MVDITSYWCKHEKLWQVRFPWLMATWSGDRVTDWVVPSAARSCAERARPVALPLMCGPLAALRRALCNAGEWKFRKMLWALAEARRDQLRKALGMATSISVSQDARAGRLVIGFSCADSQSLEAATGYFSQVNLYEEGFEADAKGVYLATVYAVYKLCTRRLGSPCEFRAGADPPELMRELLEHMRQCTEAFSADAAADEQRAGSLLRGFFKGLLMRQWDKAHACKRVLSRTFLPQGDR